MGNGNTLIWVKAGALSGLIMALAAGMAVAGCGEDTVELRGPSGMSRFSIELADTPAERAQGLMHRAAMPSAAGMLFIYERPQHAVFWMKNTLIPLDMIFADATGLVTRVHAGAVPLDETPIDGGEAVVAVLEINGGLAKRLGIAPGTVLRHPALDQAGAIWPCAGE